MTLTAVFDPIYTVSFDSDGGTPVESQLVIRGETASNPGEPTRSLYTFEGWYLDGTLYDFSKPVLSDLTLTAKWKLINEPIDDGLLKEVLIDFHNGVFVCAHFRDLSGETKCAVGITSHCEFDPYRSI